MRQKAAPRGGGARHKGSPRDRWFANYGKDPELNLYWKAGTNGLSYSDGDEVERRMLASLLKLRDRSVFSEELAGEITDWPSEYHFSRHRHFLLRPLDIRPDQKVLEIGCGCGAITRYLGELGADVIGVEGALTRARIAAERCRDLPNVRIIADDFLDTELFEKFDWVLLVGVLEYAPVYSRSPNAAEDFLKAAATHLSADGRLVVAIENKLGLKYFNGCGEDHLGASFYNVQDLYRPNEPQTFGKKELNSLLKRAGLNHVGFWYPFPDYKLPRVILSDAAFADPEFAPGELLARTYARDYGGRAQRLFIEPLVARSLARNGVLGDLSNAFLAVGSKRSLGVDGGLLAVSSAFERRPEFSTETWFSRRANGIAVEKKRRFPYLANDRSADDIPFRHSTGEDTYVSGPLLLWRIIEARARGGGEKEIAEAFTPWFRFLLGKAKFNLPKNDSDERRSLSAFTIDGAFVDCTPFNLVESDDGLAFIDREWRFDGEVPLGYVVTRAVTGILVGFPGLEDRPVSIDAIIRELCARHGISLTDGMIAHWSAIESKFLFSVAGIPVSDRFEPAHSNRLRTFALELADKDQTLAALARTVEESERTLGEARGRLSETQSELALHKDRALAALSAERQALAAVSAEREALARAVEESERALVEVRGRLSHTQSELAQRRHEAEETAAELAASRRRLAQSETEAAERAAEARRLAAELWETRREAAKAREEAAAADMVSRRRVDEIVAMTGLLREQEEALKRAADEPQAAVAKVEELQRAVAAAEHKLAASARELGAEREQLSQTEARLNERFAEIATLTRMLHDKQTYWAADDREWMRQAAAVLLGGGSWKGKLVWLLPGPLAHALRKVQLKRRGLFDADAYLRANPDVARKGADPLRHYIVSGIKEGRPRA